jgi:hypothetical protein
MSDIWGLLQYPVMTEMMTWTDETGARDLKAAVERVEVLLKDIRGKLP